MSHRSTVHHHHLDYHRRQGESRGRPGEGRANPRRAAAAADYTLGHKGRQVRLGPVAFWTIVGTLVIMAAWSIVTATYFAFRDDFLTRLLARQAEMQYAYEDRVAELRAQIDRLTSRQLLDQEQYEQKLDQLVRRQSVLEQRSATLSALDPSITGSVRPPARAAVSGDRAPTPVLKPAPISDKVILVAPPDREARMESRVPAGTPGRLGARSGEVGIGAVLARLQSSLDRVEAGQTATLNVIEDSYDAKARRMRGVLADLGLDVGKMPAKSFQPGVGGPFVPVNPRGDLTSFDRQLFRINLVRGDVERLTRTLISVPVRKPLPGEIDTTSGFGMRMDPFLRAPAMHTGLDFRGDYGEPVHATAAGTVTQAGWSGGYGKMVEIDHGNGFATRYGHMSAIDVEVGQTVRLGQVVGKLGSTGRSTGPHLHYETRIDGDAVDPQRFLRAGVRLGTLL
jgi:murein DD-endopeptidase MepM/ murein hydrolase activator NlpD